MGVPLPDKGPIRAALPSEAEAVRALVERAYAPWVAIIGRRPAPMDDDYPRHIAAGKVFVFDLGGSIVAVVVIETGSEHMLADNVAVDPAHQGAGLGRQMLLFVETRARNLGLSEIRLFTHIRMTSNIRLYERIGFKQTHSAIVDGYHRVFMAKSIAGTDAPP